MTTCSESGQVRKEAAIRSLCRASESIERAIFARFYQTAQCSTLRATQGDNLSFKRQGMTRRSMPCLFHANLFALGVARWRCQNIGAPVARALRGGVSLVLGCACGIARLPNISPPAGPLRPKITRKGRITLIKSIPRVVLLAGCVKTSVAMWFKRRRCCCLIFCS